MRKLYSTSDIAFYYHDNQKAFSGDYVIYEDTLCVLTVEDNFLLCKSLFDERWWKLDTYYDRDIMGVYHIVSDVKKASPQEIAKRRLSNE